MVYVLLVVAAIADCMTTLMGVARFGIGGEANPVAQYAFSTFGPWGFIGMKAVALGLFVLLLPRAKEFQVAAGFGIGMWTFGAFTGCLSLLLVS
jgi:hypothetical protein